MKTCSRVRALALGATLVILVGAMFGLRDRLIGSMLYHPTPGVDITPEQLGVDADQVFLTPEDDPELAVHAYWLEQANATRAILFLHGNAGNASHRLPNAVALRNLGAHVLLLDYRGYGRSSGRPSEEGLYADARAGLAYLIDSQGIREERVVLFGRSLGGAVAVDLAQDRRLGGVILESAFSSLSDAGSQHFSRAVRPLLRGSYDSAAKIAKARAPLLFFHGNRDTIVPYALGRALYEAAPEPKSFVTLEGAGHNDTIEMGGPRYFVRIGSFLDEVVP